MAYYPGHPLDDVGQGNTVGRFGQDVSSSEVMKDDLVIERATNGLINIRSFYSSAKKEFMVTHTVSAADRVILDAFYVTNKAVSFEFHWQATDTSYTICRYIAAPTYSLIGPGFWTYTNTIAETHI